MSERAGAALQKVHLLLLNQVVTRVLTFVLNLFVVRAAGAATFGIVSVQLYLLYTTTLFVSREGLRKSTLRVGYTADARPSQSIPKEVVSAVFAQSNNVAWLAVPLAAVSAVALLKVFLSWAPVFDTAAELQAYQSSALIFAASAVVESFAEPLYTLFARQVNVAVRVKVESFATLVRCVGTFVPVCWLGMGMVGFAVGQALFSVAYVLAYAWLARGTILDKAGAGSADLSAAAVFPVSLGGLAPRLISEAEAAAVDSYLARTCQGSDGEKAEAHGKRGFLERQFHRELFGLSATFTLQSAEKLLLQEGEKLVLVAFGGVSAADQGVYAVVQNTGSLVARILLQPVEEACAAEFASQIRNAPRAAISEAASRQGTSAVSGAASAVSGAAAAAPAGSIADSQAALPLQTRVKLAHTLRCVMRVLTTGALIFPALGSNFSLVFFDLFYGSKWSATIAPSVLSWYFVYIVVMAVNGVSEAFLHAAMPVHGLNSMTYVYVGFSAVQIAATVLLLPLGLPGLVLSNCLGMGMRIAYSLHFAQGLLNSDPSGKAQKVWVATAGFPPGKHVMGFSLVYALTSASFRLFIKPLCVSAAAAAVAAAPAVPSAIAAVSVSEVATAATTIAAAAAEAASATEVASGTSAGAALPAPRMGMAALMSRLAGAVLLPPVCDLSGGVLTRLGPYSLHVAIGALGLIGLGFSIYRDKGFQADLAVLRGRGAEAVPPASLGGIVGAPTAAALRASSAAGSVTRPADAAPAAAISTVTSTSSAAADPAAVASAPAKQLRSRAGKGKATQPQ